MNKREVVRFFWADDPVIMPVFFLKREGDEELITCDVVRLDMVLHPGAGEEPPQGLLILTSRWKDRLDWDDRGDEMRAREALVQTLLGDLGTIEVETTYTELHIRITFGMVDGENFTDTATDLYLELEERLKMNFEGYPYIGRFTEIFEEGEYRDFGEHKVKERIRLRHQRKGGSHV